MSVVAETDSERVVLQFLATLSAGDLEGVRAMLHEDATWTPQMQQRQPQIKHGTVVFLLSWGFGS